jgi:hypothetical protein
MAKFLYAKRPILFHIKSKVPVPSPDSFVPLACTETYRKCKFGLWSKKLKKGPSSKETIIAKKLNGKNLNSKDNHLKSFHALGKKLCGNRAGPSCCSAIGR